MKREIKFRGMDARVPEDSVHWVYGAYVKHLPYTPAPIGTPKIPDSDYEYAIVNDAFSDWQMPRDLQIISIRPNTVGQYTDLHDKNGREIYEGDIIVTHPKSRYEAPKSGVVQFGESCPIFRYKTEDGEEYNIWSSNANRTYEIIGNIWEDKQLLEGKHEQK